MMESETLEMYIGRVFGKRASQPGAAMTTSDIMQAMRTGVRPEAPAAAEFISSSIMQVHGFRV